MAGAVRVTGLKELQRALAKADKDTARSLREGLMKAGQVVTDDAQGRFSGIDPGSAAGYRPRNRRAGLVAVEQSRRRVTGQRGDYGALQMRRALVPALAAKAGDIEKALEDVLDQVADGFN